MKIDNINDCWIWQKSINNSGYGTIRYNGKTCLAHRISFMLYYKIYVPSEICILHKCDVRNCCNPHHLMTGYHQDNYDDMVKKGRARHCKGEKNGGAKLSDNDVIEIRNQYANAELHKSEIAKFYNISSYTVHNIVRGKTWKETGGKISYFNDNLKRCKLKENQVKEIKILLKNGESQINIAKTYNVGRWIINSIKRNRTWKQVTIDD